jgi:hypothetical protein
MSEQGWRGFLAAEGVNDWVVLHGGATTVFRVGSLSEAAHLAEAVAKAPGIAGAGLLLTLADTRVALAGCRDTPHHDSLATRRLSCSSPLRRPEVEGNPQHAAIERAMGIVRQWT